MTVASQTSAYELAPRFAEFVRDEPSARVLYFRQWGLVSEFWLVTDPIDNATARRLRHASRLLRHAFPEALIDFRLLNPRKLGDTDPVSLIPAGTGRRTLH